MHYLLYASVSNTTNSMSNDGWEFSMRLRLNCHCSWHSRQWFSQLTRPLPDHHSLHYYQIINSLYYDDIIEILTLQFDYLCDTSPNWLSKQPLNAWIIGRRHKIIWLFIEMTALFFTALDILMHYSCVTPIPCQITPTQHARFHPFMHMIYFCVFFWIVYPFFPLSTLEAFNISSTFSSDMVFKDFLSFAQEWICLAWLTPFPFALSNTGNL